MTSTSASIFNATLAGAAVAALDEYGWLDELAARGEVATDTFAAAHSIDLPSLTTLIRALAATGAVRLVDGVARPGDGFAELVADKGYFLWLLRGYGEMLTRLSECVRVPGEPFRRDGRYIALAGRDYGARHVDGGFRKVLDAEPFRVVADIGCGSAERIIGLVREDPAVSAIGIEVDDRGVEVAREAVRVAGLGDRIRIVHADARTIEPSPELAEVDTLFAFFNGHDLWPRHDCKLALDRIHAACPRAGRFLLCDTYRSDLPADAEVPTFTLGFEMTHAVMRQYVPSREEWRALFAETRWRLADEHPIGIPFSSIFELRRG